MLRTCLKQAGAASVAEAARLLRAGEVVGIPTETVYGLAANALSDEAVPKIFAAKGRPQDNPLISHIASLDMLPMVVREVPGAAYRLAEAFWPGPLTLILPRSKTVYLLLNLPYLLFPVRAAKHIRFLSVPFHRFYQIIGT